MTTTTTINDRYRLGAEIGRGGMGVVYRGHDLLLGRDVAVKLLFENVAGAAGKDRLLNEARAAARLNHPNIVAIYDAGEADGSSYIVMELLEGESLYLHRPDSLTETLGILAQICDALAHAHAQGVIHRDLKPENVIVLSPAAGESMSAAGARQAKLTDFGLARSVGSRLSEEGALVGTVFYTAPEQALGQQLDGRTDLYAFGVMLYELVAGRLPFTADDPLAVITQHLYATPVPPSTYNSDLPPALDALILKLLSKRREDRPASAAELRRALEWLRSEPAADAPGASTASRGRLDSPLQTIIGREELTTPLPLERLVSGRLIGRERELAEARAAWRQAVDPQGLHATPVLIVSGEAGVGKTALVRELRGLVEVSGGATVAGESYAVGGSPYGPIAEIIRAGFPRIDTAVPELVAADLVAIAPDLRVRYPNLPPNPALEPADEQQRLFESVVAFCAALASAGGASGLLFIVEDIQWADNGTLSLIRHLARRVRAARLPVLILLTYREAELSCLTCVQDVLLDLERERLSGHIELQRFNRDLTRNLLTGMFGEEPEPALVDAIYAETEGNLLFIEEICKALVEEGKIYRVEGHWHSVGVDSIGLPSNVRLLVLARIGRLPEKSQETLRLAAIFGREFDFALLRAASDLDEDSLIEALELAERVQLIVEVQRRGGETFAFAHGLFATTLRESISGLRRHRLHRRAAAAIAELQPNDHEALAYHYAEAGDDGRALEHLSHAADRARRVYANDDAIRLYTAALELLPENDPARFDLLSARASVYNIIGRRDAQAADVEALLALADDPAATPGPEQDARRCEALLVQAEYYLDTVSERAREPAQRAEALARSLGDPAREGRALLCLGRLAFYRVEFAQSRDTLEHATAHFRKAGLLADVAACLGWLSMVLSRMNDYPAAQRAVEESISLCRQVGDRRQEAIGLSRLAMFYESQNKPADALPYAEQALALHRKTGDRPQESAALNVLGIRMVQAGRVEEGERYFRQSLALAEELGWGWGIIQAGDSLVRLHYILNGAHEAGLDFLEAWLARAQRTEDRSVITAVELWRARLLIELGQFGQAHHLVHAMLASIGPDAVVGDRIALLWGLARCHAGLGEFAAADATADMLEELVKPTGLVAPLAAIQAMRGWIAWSESRADGLEALLADFEERIARMPRDGEGWIQSHLNCLEITAMLRLMLGDASRSLADTTEALDIMERWRTLDRLSYEGLLYTHNLALRASGQTQDADGALRRAWDRVQQVAVQTQSESLRRSWLENVKANREIVAAYLALSPG